MVDILSKAEIEEVLKSNMIGRIGCSSQGKTYIIPVTYVYLNDYVLCHSYDGKKIEWMRNNPSVCFEIDEFQNYNKWRCVIIQGTYEELTTASDVLEAKRHFTRQTMPVKNSRTAVSPDERNNYFSKSGPRTDNFIFYVIRISEISGRYEK